MRIIIQSIPTNSFPTNSPLIWTNNIVFITNWFTTNWPDYLFLTNIFVTNYDMEYYVVRAEFIHEPIVTKSNDVWRITFKP